MLEMRNIKTPLLKIRSNRHITLLSFANGVPLRFIAQQRVKYSSRPTASQLKVVSDTISNWFENHRPQETQISTVTDAPFRSKLESNGLQVDRNRNFSERTFQLLQYSGQHPSFSAYWADLMTKTDSTFPAFSLRIADFAVQFSLRCKFPFYEKRHSSQVWGWRDLPKPITILCQRTATSGIASFCIDHRWRQIAFFVMYFKMGSALLSPALREIKQLLCVQSLILHYIKQIDSMLPCICPVINQRGRQNVVRTSVTHSVIPSCATFMSIPHFDVICDLLLDRYLENFPKALYGGYLQCTHFPSGHVLFVKLYIGISLTSIMFVIFKS